jgi:SNF2 family DNA or RNA helicase
MYKEIDEDLVSSLPDDMGNVEVANAMTKILHLQQVTSGFAKTDGNEVEIDDGKLQALEEWLDGVPQDEPIVVFTRFILDATRVHTLLKSLGRNPGYQTGAGSDWQHFQSGDCDSIVVNVASGGAGISLTRARYAVYFSVGYNVLDYQQSRRRLVRPGQTRPVTFYHLCIPRTVDQHIYTIYKQRMSAVSQVANEMMSDAELARNVLSMMKVQKLEDKQERRERLLIQHHGVEALNEQ